MLSALAAVFKVIRFAVEGVNVVTAQVIHFEISADNVGATKILGDWMGWQRVGKATGLR